MASASGLAVPISMCLIDLGRIHAYDFHRQVPGDFQRDAAFPACCRPHQKNCGGKGLTSGFRRFFGFVLSWVNLATLVPVFLIARLFI